MSAKKICVSILKGGEGKSTITINLAAFLANSGKRVLIVGEDPQEDLTNCYLIGAEGFDEFDHHTLSDVIAGNISIHEAIYTSVDYQKYVYEMDNNEKVRRTKLKNEFYHIDMIPAGKATANVDTDDPMYFDHLLKDLYDEYDYILFDTPPAENDSTLLVYMVSDYLIIPVDSFAGIQTISNLLMEGVAWAVSQGSKMEILGAVQNKFSGTRKLSQYKNSILGDYDNLYVYDAVIRNNSDVENAFVFATPLASYRTSPVTSDFYAFYKETLDRIAQLEAQS